MNLFWQEIQNPANWLFMFLAAILGWFLHIALPDRTEARYWISWQGLRTSYFWMQIEYKFEFCLLTLQLVAILIASGIAIPHTINDIETSFQQFLVLCAIPITISIYQLVTTLPKLTTRNDYEDFFSLYISSGAVIFLFVGAVLHQKVPLSANSVASAYIGAWLLVAAFSAFVWVVRLLLDGLVFLGMSVARGVSDNKRYGHRPHTPTGWPIGELYNETDNGPRSCIRTSRNKYFPGDG